MMNVQNVQLRIHPPPRETSSFKAKVAMVAGHLNVNQISSRRTKRKPTSSLSTVVARAAASESPSSSGDDNDDGDDEQPSAAGSSSSSSSSSDREGLERLVSHDEEDARFGGAELAALIRGKYGRSYDVTLIKKSFMGRSLLAMNVMWKYREQRSFPLTEEEYLLRLDDVAATLRCWGAVSHVRATLAKLKERPRIGKAVSIFIDMDQTGARSDEWIYK